MPAIHYKHFDEYRDHGTLKGIFLAGCVERGDGSSFRRKAHAHNHRGTPFSGWICIRSRHRLMTKRSGRPSDLMLHELAHLLAPNLGHNQTWRRRFKELKQKFWITNLKSGQNPTKGELNHGYERSDANGIASGEY